MNPVIRLIPFAAVAALAVGCATQSGSDSATTSSQTSGSTQSQGTSGQTGTSSTLNNPPDPVRRQGMLANRSVYYDFDRYEIKPESRALIEAHARYLRENPNVKV